MTTSEIPIRETSLLAQPLKLLVRTVKGRQETKVSERNESALTLDETIELLRPKRRRYVLEYLATMEGSRVSVRELADATACAEYDRERTNLRSEERKRVYIALQQSHLPQLNEAKVVVYDGDANIVALGPTFEQLWQAYTVLQDALF